MREEEIPLADLNLFIGANASGKSTILDALRLLHEGVQARDFKPAVYSRGGIIHLAWKGEEASNVELVAYFEDDGNKYEWSIRLERQGFDFAVHEEARQLIQGSPPLQLLSVTNGQGWYWSGAHGSRVLIDARNTRPTVCVLGAAVIDESFPARGVAEFISRWGFYDPSPFVLRRGWAGLDATRFDPHGRNLAERLFVLRESAPDAFEQVVRATQTVLGLPTKIELRESREADERIFFVQTEPDLKFPVHQIGASSGTLRMLALMTALFGESENSRIGIEEPENHVHPAALKRFAEYLLMARRRVQILVTTHSPLLLDYLDAPEAVCVVRKSPEDGTRVRREAHAQAVRRALKESGFGLGEFYETKGFGG